MSPESKTAPVTVLLEVANEFLREFDRFMKKADIYPDILAELRQQFADELLRWSDVKN